MRISFDVDDTLVCYSGTPTEQHLSWLWQWWYPEPLRRGTRGLMHLNQKGGVDCQSCAWPDPEHRTINEYCENGAKAFGDEATTATIDADFFREHSVQDLLAHDDKWLNDQGRLAVPVVLREGA